ncbi:MAG: hypothetical protein V3S13_00650, partial [Candidatus Omnitrophota bacterium]
TLSSLIPISGMSRKQRNAFNAGLSIIPNLITMSERIGNLSDPPTRENWMEYLQLMDDLAAAGSAFIPPLKLARSTVHIIAGEMTLWVFKRDRIAISDAYIDASRAKQYYEKRIVETKQLRDKFKQIVEVDAKRKSIQRCKKSKSEVITENQIKT